MIQSDREKQQKLSQIAQRYGLELLLLFGSRVTGKTHKESDYDIGYSAVNMLDLDTQGKLINELTPVIGASDERLINLVDIKKAKPLLLYAITSQTQVLYEQRPSIFAVLRAYAFKKYIETKHLREENARRVQDRTAKM